MLGQLAWPHAEMQNAWLYVRAWLLGEPHVTRVGVDYWVLIAQVPQEIKRIRLHVLAAAPEGLSFAEIIIALRERQQHEVHRGTIHALLYSGGFLHRDGRWFAAMDAQASANRLRAAFVETLLPKEQEQHADAPLSSAEYTRRRVNAIHSRLSEVVDMLRGEMHESTEK